MRRSAPRAGAAAGSSAAAVLFAGWPVIAVPHSAQNRPVAAAPQDGQEAVCAVPQEGQNFADAATASPQAVQLGTAVPPSVILALLRAYVQRSASVRALRVRSIQGAARNDVKSRSASSTSAVASPARRWSLSHSAWSSRHRACQYGAPKAASSVAPSSKSASTSG